MSRTYDSQDAAERYDSARELPQETAALWMKTLRDLLPDHSVDSVLDLGAGTGRFAALLRDLFDCEVLAVDPSDAMLEQGRKRRLGRVIWLPGSAENIPLDAGSVDLVWMSQVFHHIEQPQAAFREVRRVLNPDACLAVRNGTKENDLDIEWTHCFPEAQEIDDERLPSQQDIVDAVCGEGFGLIAAKTVYQFFAASFSEYYDKISQRGLSSLIAISDEAFDAGLQRLKQWAEEQPPDRPVNEPVDLFVFRVVK